jgi:uncharacterized protein YndB with AHSA1/START domain
MSAYNWGQFLLRVPVRSGPEMIFPLLCTQAGIEKWFLRKSPFYRKGVEQLNAVTPVEKGDSYQWWWYGYDDSVVEKGTILGVEENTMVHFTFGKAGHVRITLTKTADGCMVELLQDEIPTDEESKVMYHIGCSKGWLFYLANLKSIVEGGIDLRNRNLEYKDVINS